MFSKLLELSRAFSLRSVGRWFDPHRDKAEFNLVVVISQEHLPANWAMSWQVVHTYVLLSPSSITWYWLKDGDVLQLAESNGSWDDLESHLRAGCLCIPIGPHGTIQMFYYYYYHTPGSDPGPMLGNEYGRTLPLPLPPYPM